MALTKSEAIFLQAACEGELAYILSHLHTVNPKASGRNGYTALMLAAAHGHPETVKFLLPHSDANAMNTERDTALILAAEEGDLACVQVLLPHTDPNIQNWLGHTALMGAAFYGHMNCAKALAPVTDIWLRSRHGATAMRLADESGRESRIGAEIENIAFAARERRELIIHVEEVAAARPKSSRL